jgi:hypothetical protein
MLFQEVGNQPCFSYPATAVQDEQAGFWRLQQLLQRSQLSFSPNKLHGAASVTL